MILVRKLNTSGEIDLLVIPLVLSVLFLLAASGFGVWAFSGRQDYKQNVDEKIATAVEVSKKQTETAKDNEFAEKEKLPLKDYLGPAAFGSVDIKYPKTWGAYVDEKTSTGGTSIDGYFHPNFVPSITGKTSFALRVQVVSNRYDQDIKQYESNIKAKKITATPYSPAKVASVVGLRLEGEVSPQKNGIMVIVPVRDKTLKIWTESNDFFADFNTNILPNYSFEP